MGKEKIEQKVNVSGEAQTGDITLIGKIVYNIKRPALWQEASWKFLASHRGYVLVAVVLQIGLAAAYLPYKNLYLIPSWLWGLAAGLLLAATWGWYSWVWLGRAPTKRVPTVLVTAALAGTVGWQAWQIAFPKRFDSQVYGIAIAELGEGPRFRRTTTARDISFQVYEQLCQDLKAPFAGEAAQTPCGVSGRVELRRIGVMPSSQVAHAVGKRLGADVVIWGQVLASEEGKVTIRFQVIETPDRAVNPEFPLVLPVTTTSAEILVHDLDLENDQARLKNIVVQQSKILSSFSLGLAAYLERDFPQAVLQFETTSQAMQALKDEPSLEVSAKGEGLLDFYLGKANHASGRIESGQKALTEAEAANPAEPAVPLSLALGHGSLGQVPEREAKLDTALKLVNDWLDLHPADDTAQYERGIIYQIRGQHQEALWDYEGVIERDPDFYIAYLNLAQVASELKRFDRAEASLRDAIALAEKSGANPSWAYLNLALVHQKAGQPVLAKEMYRQAIDFAPETDWMYYYYAKFLENQQEMDAVWPAYQTMIEVTRNKGWAYASLAGFLKRRGLLTPARENFQRAVHEQPHDALLRTYLAEMHFALGETDDALREYEQAIRQRQDLGYIFTSYAGARFQLEDFEGAAQLYEKALELAPRDIAVLLNLGQTYEILGRTEQAKELYHLILSQPLYFPADKVSVACERLGEPVCKAPE